MRRLIMIGYLMVLVVTLAGCGGGGGGQTPISLRDTIQGYYNAYAAAVAKEDVDEVMSFYSRNFYSELDQSTYDDMRSHFASILNPNDNIKYRLVYNVNSAYQEGDKLIDVFGQGTLTIYVDGVPQNGGGDFHWSWCYENGWKIYRYYVVGQRGAMPRGASEKLMHLLEVLGL